MEIVTWASPNYFKFCNALVRSIRYHKNYNIIHLCLLDFNDSQFKEVKNMYDNDSRIKYYHVSSSKYEENNNIKISNKTSFYQNFRPEFLLDILENTNNDICVFAANGLVFSSLVYLENYLKDNNFFFLERKKKNIFTNDKSYVKSVNDVLELVKKNINIDSILNSTTGKVVLLGTHGIKNNSTNKKIISKWSKLVKSNNNVNKQFSDMNLFVKSLIEYQIENDIYLKNYTAINIPREKNDLCDTHLIDGNKIWFAKGNLKWNNKNYIEKINFYWNWKNYIL